MRKLLPLVSIALATLLPSCFVYDESLLGEDDGNPSVGGSDGTGGSGGDGGGLSQSGGSGNGGTPGIGGSGNGGTPSGGGTASGGGNGVGGSTGGGSGTGCHGAFTGVASTLLLDDFNTEWAKIGDNSNFTGGWFVSNDGTGTGLSPTLTPSSAWKYDADSCSPTDDEALHITGDDYTNWGAGYDATLMLNADPRDMSAYAGVIFFARSDATPKNSIKVAFTHDGGAAVEVLLPPLTASWKQVKVPFPSSGVDKSKLTVVQIVAVGVDAGESFDIWIDDIHFYN